MIRIAENILSWCNNPEEGALKQAENISKHPWLIGNVCLMPDTHEGYGMPIGGVVALDNAICPNMVGVDIGCFTKDTKVALADGRNLTFDELIKESNKEHYGYSIDKNGNVQISKLEYPRKIRNDNKLLKITLDNNKIIKCTLDHIFYKRDCSQVEAKNLKIGDSLYPFDIQYAKNVLNNAGNDEHLCIFDGKKSEYVYIHILSDAYNERHNLTQTFYKRGFVRHHKDFNKFNNNPTNIIRMLYEDHFKIHADNIKYTNKIGITGYIAANKKHPGLYKRASIKRAQSTWQGKNKIINKIKAQKRFVLLNKSYEMRRKNSERQKLFNTNKFSELNSQEWMKNRIKIGKIKKILNYLIQNNLEINEYNYNNARKHFYNYSFYSKAKSLLNSLGLTFEKVANGETVKNHKIIKIEEIAGEDVYCLTCKEFGNFALEAGVFVHNCGMLAVRTNLEEISIESLKKILSQIRTIIPLGFDHHKQSQKHDIFDLPDWEETIICKQEYISAQKQIGTLGGGNHFIEIQKGDDGFIWFMIHSGSRNLGYKVANYYNKIANELCLKWKQDKIVKDQIAILPIGNKETTDYIKEMNLCLKFSNANRDLMAKFIKEIILDICPNIIFDEPINIQHNYATLENHYGKNVWVHRKGATLARKNTIGIIPGSQGTSSYIVKGLGNEASMRSCSHGAGRRMSRTKAKQELDLKTEQEKLDKKGILHAIRGKNDLEEASSAYKDIDVVMEEQKDLVKILVKLQPLAVVKG